jgi:hypothetical protein
MIIENYVVLCGIIENYVVLCGMIIENYVVLCGMIIEKALINVIDKTYVKTILKNLYDSTA